MATQSSNPYSNLLKSLDGTQYKYYDICDLDLDAVKRMPYCMRVLLECAVRNCDEFEIKKQDVERILDWRESAKKMAEIAFKPSRVLLQDFTGVPCVVDLASMRDAFIEIGGDPQLVNPLIPTDLVVDHSVVVDSFHEADACDKNESIEFSRNEERFKFLKWGKHAFKNMSVVPPGSGIVHQVNLEYLARVVFVDPKTQLLYPDSVVGTDSHTTMIDGLGVLGWGVGGIEAEAVMLGQPIYMVVPKVVGFKLIGNLDPMCTATDLVLTVTKILRAQGVVGKLVEFFGPGVEQLSVADRATISNMSPEFGATAAYFPTDAKTMEYLKMTGRDMAKLELFERYLKAQRLFREYGPDEDLIRYSGHAIVELDMQEVVPGVAGPKRPQDFVPLSTLASSFAQMLTTPVGFKGFGLPEEKANTNAKAVAGSEDRLSHGAVVIAAITSCTNTSNPAVMIQAALLARNAVKAGLKPKSYTKCSLSPGSHVVYEYLKGSGLLEYMQQINFYVTGYGCQTCIGNSGDLDPNVAEAIQTNDLVVAAVLSGNRNFEGRVHPLTRANFLASPPLVVAYALAGSVALDLITKPIGVGSDGKNVMLVDIWPPKSEVEQLIRDNMKPDLYHKVYAHILKGNKNWEQAEIPTADCYEWNPASTYIHKPPFFQNMTIQPPKVKPIKNAYCLLSLGDSITTDHISPAGKIALKSPAANFLVSKGVEPRNFNSYGSRRGNDEVMVRGTFANIRIKNKMVSDVGPYTVHIPSGEITYIYDAAELYLKDGKQSIILAGAEYGCGSSRDWAAKGPLLQGVRAVIAVSFERIHRSNLVGMGLLPLQFKSGENAESLGLTGLNETYSIDTDSITVGGDVTIEVYDVNDLSQLRQKFTARSRIDTDIELEYFKHGGILQYVLRKMATRDPSR
eukprot:Blabericola_migrator_1__8303@NODE_430_length_8568_cov_132_492766_g339_i0_p1_GENE_NODE_430_length_8568_cov_132_492766_g339_i0NODE_430_length_8568_cov_132_492766_g339_i0_p1_ORF_typecomplete_len907_score170_79Aconitase/PF00330_20/2_3e157Aconitase_C/PF00694_19/1_3e42Aconitase_2_N/PF06434_13/1e03Aconitase_2_N/PF06434_13/0_37PTVENN/PF04829_13/9_8PTVENN/PF04829_13/33_NODE_430_length_8568_cov_132_492766_g339_i013764096